VQRIGRVWKGSEDLTKNPLRLREIAGVEQIRRRLKLIAYRHVRHSLPDSTYPQS
jgi:hypothetical protein